MRQVNIHEAKTHFSKLVDTAMHGEEIIIAKAGKPAARLVPLRETRQKIRFGLMQGEVKIAKDFDASLSEDVLTGFEGAK